MLTETDNLFKKSASEIILFFERLLHYLLVSSYEIKKLQSHLELIEKSSLGKFIDNSNNLTEITFSIDGTEKQEILYGGFGVNPTLTNKNGNTVNYFSSPTMVDPHNNNSKRKGFRLNGSFSLIDILHSNIKDVNLQNSFNPKL